jgi:undecaprenyl-diphosphatase
MELIKAILLGAIQGITEFLPVSSTGHLVLAERLLNISQDKYGLTFDAALHLGTLVALLWYFKSEWLMLLRGGIKLITERKVTSHTQWLLVFLIIGTIPGMIFGLLLEHKVETVFRSPVLIAVTLIIFSGVLYYIEKIASRKRELDDLTVKDSIAVGLAQAVALVPGVSRSGITMGTGMWRGLSREAAARFAFLLSAPIIAGAGGVQLIKIAAAAAHGALSSSDLAFFAVGMISAAIFGYLTIKYFLRFLAKHSLMPFIYYRVILGILVIGLAVFHLI